MANGNGQSLIFARRRETSDLIHLLESAASDILTDEQIKTACGEGCAPGERGYGWLTSAIRHVEREHGAVWRRVRNAGVIKRQTPGEIVGMSEFDRKRVCKLSSKSVKRLALVDLAKLDDAERKRLLTTGAQLGSIAVMAAPGATKKLEARDVTKPIDMTRLLEAMK